MQKEKITNNSKSSKWRLLAEVCLSWDTDYFIEAKLDEGFPALEELGLPAEIKSKVNSSLKAAARNAWPSTDEAGKTHMMLLQIFTEGIDRKGADLEGDKKILGIFQNEFEASPMPGQTEQGSQMVKNAASKGWGFFQVEKVIGNSEDQGGELCYLIQGFIYKEGIRG